MAQRVIPVAITAEYVGGDGVTLGAAGSHSSVVLEYDFRAAGPQWEGTTKYVLWTNPQGNSTNRVNLGVDKLVEGYGGKVYHDCPTADAMCVAGWAEMVVVGVTVNNGVETVKIKTEPSRFRVLPATGRSSDNEGIAATVADQLQTEIEVVDSRKVNKPISPYDPDGVEGQVLVSLGEGATQWVDAEAPTEDVVERVLSQHPEWTTTVQDGALTSKKLKPGEIGGYRPEQFGAAGDGVTDDTAAIKSALEAAGEGGTVVLEAGARYLVKETLQMQDRQTLDGNGATLIWEGEPTMNAHHQIIGAPYIIEASGSRGPAIKILEKPKNLGGPSSTVFGTKNAKGFVEIKVGSYPDLKTGDRIVIQAARDALSQESGEFWVGTPTGRTKPCYWAEVLVVNDVEEISSNVWKIRCVGSLIYPYYLPDPTADDVARVKSDALNQTSGNVIGYYVKPGAERTCRSQSDIRKVNFLRDVVIKDMTIEAEGVTHSGAETAYGAGTWRGRDLGNTIYLVLCENARLENVKIKAYDVGRGFYMRNCWRSVYKDCSWEAMFPHTSVAVTHVYVNPFTFASCWTCDADGCTTTRAGQSFDMTYAGDTTAGEIRCPSLYISVKNCTVFESMDNAATNHSGGYGETFDNCRFINCNRELSIRSPLTTVRNCTFVVRGGDTDNIDGASYRGEAMHITFAEPTIWGCSVIGCTFVGGRAIRVAPWINRYFDFTADNYITPLMDGTEYVQRPGYAYDHVVTSETATSIRPVPPKQRDLGMLIADNTFHDCNCVLFFARPVNWLTDKQSALRDYAKTDVGISFRHNTLMGCGRHFYPIYLEPYSHGVEIDGTRFVRCASENPSYYRDDAKTDAVTCTSLINIGSNCARLKITNNTATGTGGAFARLYYRWGSLDENLGTGGRLTLEARGNRADGIRLNQLDEEDSISFGATAQTVVRQGYDVIDETDCRSVLVHDLVEGTIGFETYGAMRMKVSPTALAPAYAANLTPGCLLRSWLYLNANKATDVKWRSAVYTEEIPEDDWRLIAAAWDSGTDAAGNAVSFSTPVTVDAVRTRDDPDTGEEETYTVRVTYQPPLNKALAFANASANKDIEDNQYASIDHSTGFLSVNLPVSAAPQAQAALYAFHAIPQEYVSRKQKLYCYTELWKSNLSTDIRINAFSYNDEFYNTPPVSMTRAGIPSVNYPGPSSGLGRIRMHVLDVVPYSETLDLGQVMAPWGTVYANTISLGSTQVTENQLQALLALLD